MGVRAKDSANKGYDDLDNDNKNNSYVDDDFEANFYRKVARYVGDDGWVFTFVRNGDNDYVQLSDMVDSGKATDEQKKVFEEIQDIVSKIKEKDIFIAGADKYKSETVGDVDFARLYTFLNNIYENKFDLYDEEPIIISIGEGSEEQ